MAKFNKNLIGKITSLNDEHLRSIKHRWYQESHKDINKNQFIAQAKDWFENNCQLWTLVVKPWILVQLPRC